MYFSSLANVYLLLERLICLHCLIHCSRLKESTGWILAWTSPYLEQCVERLALNAKAATSSSTQQDQPHTRMLTVAYGSHVLLWSVSTNSTAPEGTTHRQIGGLGWIS